MANPHLNKDLPFAECYPPGEHRGAFYSQGGHYFSHEGKYLFSNEGATVGAAQAAPSTSSEPEPVVEDEIDLVAWAKGEINPIFPKVKKAMKEAGFPSGALKNTKSMTDALVASHMLSAEEVGR